MHEMHKVLWGTKERAHETAWLRQRRLHRRSDKLALFKDKGGKAFQAGKLTYVKAWNQA